MVDCRVCLVVLLLSQKSIVSGQHATCEAVTADGNIVTCSGLPDGYTIPGNFDSTALNPRIRQLDIHGDHNVVYANFTAFPARSDLLFVSFWHFNELTTAELGAEHIPFPFARLLTHNKQHIQSLALFHVKLLTLTEDDLAGFSDLRNLELLHTYLTSVSGSLFDSLGRLPSGDTIPNYEPVLAYFKIISNPDLQALDWKFLQPVSNSLMSILLSLNNLTSTQVVLSSAPFKLKKTVSITLDYNPRLVPLPEFVYRSFNTSQGRNKYLYLSLMGITLCQHELDCSCCEMQPFVQWLRDHEQTIDVRAIQCASSNRWRTGTDLVNESTRPRFDHCTTTAANASAPIELSNSSSSSKFVNSFRHFGAGI